MFRCLPWRKPVSNDGKELQRGMLVEVVRIHKDGEEVYSKENAPPDKQLYDHPSFASCESRLTSSKTTHEDTRKQQPTPHKSIRQLRAELIQGFNQVEKLFD
ncbi:hypothetical protein FPSE_07130 [Fusarium pseudograminearum CS3096]|uniref:Uncharacterized protein n=1 Tax=Fusarium pseudograminearum (strain CS3096) TaxID=1028729 RepID=K3VZN9_FUSPC|nr:hypothetical protein FPSE_07130 [Fusarium pseudograminearum CS3096]EKJ72730.1 hypothetical protein FPSE_07130 [Fusarium pseudograminearum CS3096]